MFCGAGVDWNATAAWAQALLSFAGIVVGAYIAAKVAGLPTLATRHQKLAALVSLTAAAKGILRAAQIEADHFDDGSTMLPAFDLSRFDRTIAAYAAIPPLEISPGVLVEGVLDMQENLVRARADMAELLRNAPTGIGVAGMGQLFEAAVEQAESFLSDTTAAAMEAARAERLWWKR